MHEYRQGFVARCKAQGVAPKVLLKWAKAQDTAHKQADRLVEEYARSVVPEAALAGLPTVAPGVGNIIARLVGNAGDMSPQEYRASNPARNYIPFHRSYAMGQRSKMVARESERRGAKHHAANLLAEVLAPELHMGLGAATGYALTGTRKGTAIGAGLGLAPSMLTSIAAALTKRRSLAHQARRNTAGRAALKWLVPGMANYDMWKRLGASRNLIEDKLLDKA